ncbi:MAG: hypothetical protein NC337_03735 [Roseburia sp.]|nr:hypothetical protein [Roseburia sp.]
MKYNGMKNLMAAIGVVLWVGALSPEILIRTGDGCILDENGEALTQEEAADFMDLFFFGRGTDTRDVRYRIAITELFRRQ